MPFDGETYDPSLDKEALTAQLDRVREYSLEKGWVTLAQLEQALGYPQASVSARLRDLRKTKFGGYEVQRRRVAGSRQYEYQVV